MIVVEHAPVEEVQEASNGQAATPWKLGHGGDGACNASEDVRGLSPSFGRLRPPLTMDLGPCKFALTPSS